MRNKTRLLALGLAVSMMMTIAACGSSGTQQETGSKDAGQEKTTASESSASTESKEEVDELAWLNKGAVLPIVKEGTEKTLSIYYYEAPDAGDPYEKWMYHYMVDQMNLDFELTAFNSSNKSEFLSLAFAANDLPDIIIGGGFSVSDLLKYGAQEGQIIDMAPYVNEDYMPNLTKIFDQNPEYKQSFIDPEGRMFSLGKITNPAERGNVMRAFINYDWLEACNLEMPTTLDEFIDAMRAFKAAGLAEYPIGGSNNDENPTSYILNALGYQGSVYHHSLCLRNGEVVVPYADREVFGEYLKIMNQLYTEGLIHKDYYTMDKDTVSAVLAQGTGFVTQAPSVYDKDFRKYWAAAPLTSEWNDTPRWYSYGGITIGNAVITSACEDPELAARFIDFFFGTGEENGYPYGNYRLNMVGPEVLDPDIYYGFEKVEYDNASGTQYKKYLDNQDDYQSYYEFTVKEITIWGQSVPLGYEMLTFSKNSLTYSGEEDWTQIEDLHLQRWEHPIFEGSSKGWRVAIEADVLQYVQPESEKFPSVVYLDDDTIKKTNDIKTATNEYANQEIAKFVVGERALTDAELEDFFNTLDGLGIQEYIQIYADYYESVK